MTMPVIICSPEYLTADALKCDKCDDISVGLTFVVPDVIPYTINVMLPIPAFEELVRQARAGIESPEDSIQGEAIPSKAIDWYQIEPRTPHE